MTPAPTMRSDSGAVCKAKASVEVKIAGCEKSNIGNRAGSEPVARMILSASTVTVPPEASLLSTTTLPGPANLPVPRSTSTPAFLSKASTLSRSRVTIPSLRPIMRAKSGFTSPSTSNPYSSPARARARASALASNALVGMQPRLRQVPPMRSFSTRVTAAPRRAAFSAATYPPGPPPMTTILIVPSCFVIPSAIVRSLSGHTGKLEDLGNDLLLADGHHVHAVADLVIAQEGDVPGGYLDPF